MDLIKYIANVPDFPKKGIVFKDITTLIAQPEAFKYTIECFKRYVIEKNADLIVSPDARGFIFGTPTALECEIGFIPVRKPGKLPRATIEKSYTLEYGENVLCMHMDAVKPGQKVVIIDDLLATGGTLKAAAALVEALGGEVVGVACVIELLGLGGREALSKYDVFSLVKDIE